MQETIESVRENGILTPIIVRPKEAGGYEIVSGHRRCHACELAGIDTIPAIIREIDRDTATIVMVDSNLQRENILPMEKAKAYKMKLEALKHQGSRSVSTSRQVGEKLTSVSQVANDANESERQVQRYIRLTELVPQLQQMVDEHSMALTPAVEISFLTQVEQQLLLETIDSEQCTPSLSQAQRMKQLSKQGLLNEDSMLKIMSEQKKSVKKDIVLSEKQLRKYFPESYTPIQMQMIIIKLLESWQLRRERNKNQSR